MKMKLIMEAFNKHLESNLSPQEQSQLQADIELVKRLAKEEKTLRDDRD